MMIVAIIRVIVIIVIIIAIVIITTTAAVQIVMVKTKKQNDFEQNGLNENKENEFELDNFFNLQDNHRHHHLLLHHQLLHPHPKFLIVVSASFDYKYHYSPYFVYV